MYTDDTILLFGEFKFFKLCRVPANYLLNMFKDNRCPNREIREYIKENFEKLVMRSKGLIEDPPLIIPCTKHVYATQKIAKAELKRIRESKGDHKKPIRTYECPSCSGWHLTSWTWEEWKEEEERGKGLKNSRGIE